MVRSLARDLIGRLGAACGPRTMRCYHTRVLCVHGLPPTAVLPPRTPSTHYMDRRSLGRAWRQSGQTDASSGRRTPSGAGRGGGGGGGGGSAFCDASFSSPLVYHHSRICARQALSTVRVQGIRPCPATQGTGPGCVKLATLCNRSGLQKRCTHTCQTSPPASYWLAAVRPAPHSPKRPHQADSHPASCRVNMPSGAFGKRQQGRQRRRALKAKTERMSALRVWSASA